MDLRQTLCLLLVVLVAWGRIVRADDSGEDDGIDIEDSVVEPELPEVEYQSPEPAGPVLLADHFDDKDKFDKAWVKSQAKKEGIDEDIAKYDGELCRFFFFFRWKVTLILVTSSVFTSETLKFYCVLVSNDECKVWF